MEPIRQAIERAKAGIVAPAVEAAAPLARNHLRVQSEPPPDRIDGGRKPIGEVELVNAVLESHRIVAHDVTDPRSKSFDMLRTQVLQSMDLQNWQFLAITSPTPGCGKTSTAVNLALSIARQPDRSVLLVDMDLQKPQIARYLGLGCERGLLSVLEGQTTLADSLVQARVGRYKMTVLLAEAAITGSSEWITSRAMASLLQTIKRDFERTVVIFDLPPMLSCDDVIAMLPQLHCVLLVAAAGTTTTAEIEECTRYLQSADVVRLVLNKVTDNTARYY